MERETEVIARKLYEEWFGCAPKIGADLTWFMRQAAEDWWNQQKST